uniref:Uncharacterized protein n=1 Tax=Oryza brachyantha TaxID=4533 RepID=J3LGV6_ORYBR
MQTRDIRTRETGKFTTHHVPVLADVELPRNQPGDAGARGEVRHFPSLPPSSRADSPEPTGVPEEREAGVRRRRRRASRNQLGDGSDARAAMDGGDEPNQRVAELESVGDPVWAGLICDGSWAE